VKTPVNRLVDENGDAPQVCHGRIVAPALFSVLSEEAVVGAGKGIALTDSGFPGCRRPLLPQAWEQGSRHADGTTSRRKSLALAMAACQAERADSFLLASGLRSESHQR